MHADRLEKPQLEPSLRRGTPDIVVLLGALSDAIAILTVAQRALEAGEIPNVGDETVTLRYGLSLLRAAYNDLDLASGQSRRRPRALR